MQHYQHRSRTSNRLKEVAINKCLKETPEERQNRILGELEMDNYQKDPEHEKENDDGTKSKSKKKVNKGKKPLLDSKKKLNKTFDELVAEDQAEAAATGRVSYTDVDAEASTYPPRKFCAVCGFLGKYRCTICEARYCSTKCLLIHKDTRCLKWTE